MFSMKRINTNCLTPFYEARRLFAITYVLEIHMYVFRPHPGEIVKMSQDKFRIFDLSRISAFIKYIVYWGFLVHRPLVNLYMKVTLKERRSRAPLMPCDYSRAAVGEKHRCSSSQVLVRSIFS